MRFTINGSLPGLNEYTKACRGRNGHVIASRMKHEAEDRIIEAAKVWDARPIHGPFRIDIHWVEATRRRDPDNVFMAVKFVLDALTKAGLIDGDDQAHVKGIRHSLGHDAKYPRIEVEVSGCR